MNFFAISNYNMFISVINNLSIIISTCFINVFALATHIIFNFINHIFSVLLISFIIHAFVLIFVLSGLLGYKIKDSAILLINYLEKTYYLPHFILVLVLIYYFSHGLSPIYAETSGTIIIKDSNISFSTEILNLFQQTGNALVFSSGSKLAVHLLNGSKLGFIPKLGATLITASGFTMTFNIVSRTRPVYTGQLYSNQSNSTTVTLSTSSFPSSCESTASFMQGSAMQGREEAGSSMIPTETTLSVADVKIIPNLNTLPSSSVSSFYPKGWENGALQSPSTSPSYPPYPLVAKARIGSKQMWGDNINKPFFNVNKYDILSNNTESLPKSNGITDNILAVGFAYPENIWQMELINSPKESIDPILLSIFNNTLWLNFVITYLVFLLIIIFTSKLLLDRKINIDGIVKLPLGNYIHKIVSRYLAISKDFANVWIYFILISLLIFSITSSYAINFLLNNLT